MTSITRKLHFLMIRKRLGICLLLDALALLGGSASYLAGLENARIGKLAFEYSRSLSFGEATGRLFYCVSDEAGRQLLMYDVMPFFKMAGTVCAGLFLFQLLMTLFRYGGEDKKVRRILNPINEIALRADELSRMSFTEEKYQLLEDAIEHIDPDGAQTLSFGDADLVGVEAAMNNLLLRMRDTYRQQARFVNDASHELRTPIAVIQGYANMLDRWGKEDEKILDESITAIRNESDHMNHLVEQLLFLARGDSGKTVVNRVRTELLPMMLEVYEESFMIDEAHPHRFRPRVPGFDYTGDAEAGETVFPHDGPCVLADAQLLKQAVRILIDNAAKYTKAGDEILLSCGFAENREVYVEVQDTGIGMAEADVQHMFERFYRSDEARSYQGTGLGLSIAKWIVDKHQGHFEILSRTELGTRIRILLPSYTLDEQESGKV